MADQELTDGQLVEELKRYGRIVPLPIKWNKRPILIKQLNHFRAKENPIVHSSKKSAARLSRKKIDAFSSDESDTDDNKSIGSKASNNRLLQRLSNSHQKPVAPDDDGDIFKRPNLRSRRSVGSSITVSPKVQNETTGTKSGKLPAAHHSGISTRTQSSDQYIQSKPTSHLGEFSDSEIEDGSMYEVVNRSINTSFPYSQHDDYNSPGPSNSFRRTPHRVSSPANITLHPHSGFKTDTPNLTFPSTSKKIANNHVSHRPIPRLPTARQTNFKTHEESRKYAQNISKLLVIVLGIFFVFLAASYIYMRREMFIAFTAVSNDSETIQDTDFIEDFSDSLLPERPLFNKSVYRESVPFLKMVEKELSERSGKYKCGYIHDESASVMSRSELDQLSEKISFSHGKEALLTATLGLVIASPSWGVRAQSSLGDEATSVGDVTLLESLSPSLGLFCRIKRAIRRVAIQIIAVILFLLFVVLAFVGLKFWWSIKETEQQKVYDMVDKILAIIQTHHENHPDDEVSDTQPYVAVQHVRDQLLPPSKRKQLQPIWDKAVQFIEANESRIRLESQIIEGEDFMVWRWIHSLPNGGKVWQGQAFGEYSEAYSATPKYCPFPTLKIRNMFNAEVEEGEDWDLKVKDAILEKTGSNEILHIHIDKNSNEGCVYLKCSSCEEAGKVYKALHGWYFDGRLVTVKFFRLEQYHEKFPYSMIASVPLKPTTNKKLSLSRPFYRSSLERT